MGKVILKDRTERVVMSLQELLENYTGGLVELIRVLDTAGNVVAKADDLEIVYDVTLQEQIDPLELTPEQENEWLRSGGF
jgi:hypothetical protein